MKTKLPLLMSVVALIGYTQASNAQVLSQGSSNNNTENSILNVQSSNNSAATAIGIADNDQSAAGYHHGSGSGEGAFTGNMINLGVGFVNVGNSFETGSTSSTKGPAIEVSYEHALGSFGIGANFSFQSQSASIASQGEGYNPITFATYTYTNTDKYTFSLIQFAVRAAYHISAGDKLDPYVGIAIGYCTASESETFSTTDPNSPADGNTGGGSGTASLTGVEFGGYAGIRYFFTDHIGAWFEIQYSDASFKIPNTSLSVSIDPSTFINLGLAIKF